ncbi:MAG: ATP-grasp domain-containing protein [Spirochaetaceae bacterium]|nr:MAG: ATP-grasp domain-containing protein [Spirochaetaceae bacterium]
MGKKKIFIVGLDEFNKGKLERLPHAEYCEFHGALDFSEIRGVESFDMKALIETATERIRAVTDRPDAIAAYYDFPATDLVPILAERFGTPGPTLESVLKCEHKYWSRLEQQKTIPDNIPRFFAFDPLAENALENIPLLPPYWIKPIKSFRSFLAYRINGPGDYERALPEIREKGDYMTEPFTYLFRTYPLPAEIGQMRETFMAESLLSGAMCTVEGYVYKGEVVIYGVVDSVREQDRSSFTRYEYPSSMPREIQFRMVDVSRRVISGIGLDNSPFNIEFFWDQTHDHVGLLEINPRISQAHTDLFEKVHGISHHAVMIDLALGEKPGPVDGRGRFRVAGHFMLRSFRNGVVRRVPSAEEIESIQKEMPDTVVRVKVRPGMKLSDLHGQDSYSYELAVVYIGGQDQAELLEKYDRCAKELKFEIEGDGSNKV